jgi:hypothetical protein
MGFDTAGAKQNFFDRKAVLSRLDKGVKQALSKFGAFVRRRAQTSIRKRKGVSAPGSPPSSHVGTLKKLIFFSYDPGRKSVVIGPVLKSGSSDAPKLLEHGGAGRRGKYIARPFMRPAFAAELPKAPQNFKAIIR